MTVRPSILVTGGAGYIGSHCCSALYKAGFNPVTYDNLSTGHQHFVNWGPLIVGDIRDGARLKEAFRDNDILAVMHFAAASSVAESIADPAKYESINVEGTRTLLGAMHGASCSKLICSSSGAVYGEKGKDLIGEGAPCHPVSPYGRTKWDVEKMVGESLSSSDLCAISLRYFNAAGAENSCLIGELRDPETHLIPRALMKLQGYLSGFAIYGEDYDTPDGTAIRDYIHVVDLAEAHCLALNALIGGTRSGTFNLGTGNGFSVKEIVTVIERCTGQTLDAVKKTRRAGDPAALVADPSYAKRMLGFSPKYSGLESIIASAWKWHQVAHPAFSTKSMRPKSASWV